MKNIILFNTVVGTSNIGDQIIYNSLKQEMSDILEDAFVVEYATHLRNYTLPLYIRMRTKRKYAKNCDFKFIMGTNLLSDDLLRTRRQWMITPGNSMLYRNCIMVGVGLTRNRVIPTFYSKVLYNSILNKEYAHSVRDEESKALLEKLGAKVINTGCPSLWNMTKEHCDTIPRKKSKRVVYSLSGYSDQLNYEHDQLLINILENEYDSLFFWNQTAVDYPYFCKLDHKKPTKIINGMDQYRTLLREGDIDYVGTRLHGGIYALQNSVRTIVIAIDHRAEGFNKNNNLCIIHRDDVGVDLSDLINSEFDTNIIIDSEKIRLWKNQFVK